MSLPYFPLYVTDYEGDTAHLTIEEDGAYMRLLRLCWRTPGCSIPDDPAWIRRQMRCDQATFDRSVMPVIKEFFRHSKSRYHSPRLTAEYERTAESKERRKNAGRIGGEKSAASRKLLNSNNSDPSNAQAYISSNAQAYQNQNHIHIKRDTKVSPKSDSDFDLFWSKYPRKVGKGQALKAWRAAVKKCDAKVIIEGLDLHLDDLTAKSVEYQPHPATWLNGERWADEVEGGDSAFWANFKWEDN